LKDGSTGDGGDHCSESWAADPFDHSHDGLRRRPGRTGVAGRNEGVGTPFADEVGADTNGRVPLATQRAHGRVVHLDDFTGIDDLNGRGQRSTGSLELTVNVFLASDQQ